MRVDKVFKIFVGLMAITSLPLRIHGTYTFKSFGNTASFCPNSINLPLPVGCEAYELLQGDPGQAMSFYMLESHQKCDLLRKKCTTALLNQKFNHDHDISKSEAVLVFEEAGIDQTVLCKDYEMDALLEDCRGWNRPSKERSRVTLKFNAIKHLISGLKDSLASVSQLPLEKQKSRAIEITQNYISGISKFLIAAKKEAENQPPNTYFYKTGAIVFNEFQLENLQIFLQSLEKSKIVIEAFQSLETVFWDIRQKTQSYIQNEEISIHIPNQFLLKTMKKIANQNKVGIAYVGRMHMHKPSLIEVGMGKIALDAVDELYEALDSMADKNPYAVLSCK